MAARTSGWFRGMLAGMVVLGVVWAGGATAGWSADFAPGTQGFAGLSAERDWPWWRGPARNGWSPSSATAPTTWSDAQHVLWRVPLPGRGHSSPIVVGERIYLTTADTRQQIHTVLALERATGRQVWKVDVSQGGFPARNHPKNTEATCTLACDGERLFAAFFHHQQIEVVALDLEGKQRWRAKAGAFNPQRYEYGYAPSPLLYRDLVIIAGEYDGESFLTALDRVKGQPRWRTPRPANITFSSPVVAFVAGRDQLLLSGAEQVASYDPQTGKQLWSTPGTTAATCGTMVWDGDVVIASGGYPKAETLAVRADGSGTVLWRNGQKCYEQSLLAVDGHVYGLTDNGILFCWRVADGRELWKERLKGPVSASPVLVNGRIYWTNEFGTTYVFRPNPQRFELLAQNQLGEEGFASPAVSGDRLFLRTAVGNGERRQEFLYCLGEKK
ncbi:MAG: PQQ-binding-like beta-propeller repeat protein [Pirellulales bacterium]